MGAYFQRSSSRCAWIALHHLLPVLSRQAEHKSPDGVVVEVEPVGRLLRQVDLIDHTEGVPRVAAGGCELLFQQA